MPRRNKNWNVRADAKLMPLIHAKIKYDMAIRDTALDLHRDEESVKGRVQYWIRMYGSYLERQNFDTNMMEKIQKWDGKNDKQQ